MNHTERTIIETYSVLFDNLSDACKTALIEYLSETMKSSKKVQNPVNGFALSFGKWEGAEQTPDEIKDEIKRNRSFRRKDAILD
jgi:ribosomal protein S17E